MRWFFWLLLITNGGIFYYGMQHDGAQLVGETKIVPPVGDLSLLKEVAQDTSSALSEVSIPSYENVATEGDQDSESESSQLSTPEGEPKGTSKGDVGDTVSDAVIAEQVSEPTPSEPSDDEKKPVEPPAVQPEVEMAAQPKQVVMTTEEPPAVATEASAPSVADADPNALPQLVDEPLVCGAFGVFKKGSEGRQLLDQLEQLGMDASLRREEVEKVVGYWVIIPSIETRTQSINTVKQLREQGIKDIRRFVRDDKRHGISLGLFGRKQNAERRRKELAAIGQQVEIKSRTKPKTEYRVDYSGTQEQLNQILQSLTTEKVEHQLEEYPCERAVTPKQP